MTFFFFTIIAALMHLELYQSKIYKYTLKLKGRHQKDLHRSMSPHLPTSSDLMAPRLLEHCTNVVLLETGSVKAWIAYGLSRDHQWLSQQTPRSLNDRHSV